MIIDRCDMWLLRLDGISQLQKSTVNFKIDLVKSVYLILFRQPHFVFDNAFWIYFNPDYKVYYFTLLLEV